MKFLFSVRSFRVLGPILFSIILAASFLFTKPSAHHSSSHLMSQVLPVTPRISQSFLHNNKTSLIPPKEILHKTSSTSIEALTMSTETPISSPTTSPSFLKSIPTNHLPTKTHTPRTAFNFIDSDFSEEDALPFLSGPYIPAKIIFFDETKMDTFPAITKDSKHTFARTLMISSEALAQKIARERLEESYQRPSPALSSSTNDESVEPEKIPLNAEDYEINYFHPGKRDDGVTIIDLPKDINKSIYGPDFSYENINPKDKEHMTDLKSRVVSFGHFGEMVLQMKDQGFLWDEPGPDFVIFENVFRYGKGRLYQEFAQVGVSETLDDKDFVWFPCAPDKGILKGCAGVVPTDEGGDTFDLAEIGVKKAKYIKIRDTGHNFNLGKNTEGFDLDAMRIIHGYKYTK